MSVRLEGRVALVTGAARGQGRAHAVRLAAEGADVIAVDIAEQIETIPYPLATEEDLGETARQVEACGRAVAAFKVDVRDLVGLEAAVAEGFAQLGRLDVVVANAGIASPTRGTLELSAQEWRDMIDVNLTGVWHTAKVAVPYIRRGGRGGSVIITSSAAGLKGYPNVGHYVATKHALVGLMRSLANELAPESIRVNTIHPTQVDTMMIQNTGFYEIFEPDNPAPDRATFAVASQATNALPTPWVEPSDVAAAACFLAGDEARYITGVALPVDAGALIR